MTRLDNTYPQNIIYLGGINDAVEIAYPESVGGFSPSESYPECPFLETSPKVNVVYKLIRDGLYHLGYDRKNFGTKEWNPLSEIIKPGSSVLIKPNMVLHQNLIRENGIECLVTHPSLVRAMLDYVIIALKGTGNIMIADAPLQECIFNDMLKNSGYDELLSFYKRQNIEITIRDLRNYKSIVENGVHIQQPIAQPNKRTIVNLGEYSSFVSVDSNRYKRLRITNYNPDIMSQHHNSKKNEYSIASDILNADVIINLPKPKTHRYAGVTISLKNMIGINTNKDWLPHHSIGSKEEGGDAYIKPNYLKRLSEMIIDQKNRYIGVKKYTKATYLTYLQYGVALLLKFTKQNQQSVGNWYGNDTIWRTILDLNRIVRYADKNGNICDTQQRKVFNVADMIISGEKEGPLSPTPKKVGIIAMAEDAVCMDETIASIMGVDYTKIPTIKNSKKEHDLPIGCGRDAHIISNKIEWDNKDISEIKREIKPFILTSGWQKINE